MISTKVNTAAVKFAAFRDGKIIWLEICHDHITQFVFIVFYGGLWTQAGLLARIIQLSAASTVDRSLYTASLLSHTRVVDRPQLCCHLTLGGGRVLPRLQHWLLHWVAVARWVSGALTAEMLLDSTNSSQAKQNINIYMHVLKCQYVWIQIWGLYRKPNIFM